MESCEVLIVGGGPAGSTCARQLRRAGVEVLLMEAQTFPRDKPCAGWITPAVLATLGIAPAEYGRGRLLQEIRGFRTALLGGPELATAFGQVVSYGIRRSEFDAYLLQRSEVPTLLGEPLRTLQRHNGAWLVNGRLRPRLLVGAGGHRCPVARHLGAVGNGPGVIVAQAAEWLLDPTAARRCPVPADTPWLYFCRDLQGYGWLVRKEDYLNVGFGRIGNDDFKQHLAEFHSHLDHSPELAPAPPGSYRGHLYLPYRKQGGRALVADQALLIGDAAGLAYPASGEGILPAIESGLLAAATIVASQGDYRRQRLAAYPAALAARHGGDGWRLPTGLLPPALVGWFGSRLLASPRLVRNLVLERWFLHARQPLLSG